MEYEKNTTTTSTTQTTTSPSPREEGSVGPVVATIIILAVIVLGGLYFWSERNDTVIDNVYTPAATTTDGTMNTSDDTSSIEADLNNTNIDDEDFEMQAS